MREPPRHDVFISYRRDSGAAEARLLREALVGRGVSVFLDVTDLRRGYFDEELLKRISATPNFVPILTPGALDRPAESQDWMRQEIAHAIREKRNVIPIFVGAFAFPAALPDDLVNLPRHQGIQYSHQYFDAMTQSIVDALELDSAPRRPVANASGDKRGAPARTRPHWSYAALKGGVIGLVGGGINALVLMGLLDTVTWEDVLLVFGVVPGAAAGPFVRSPDGAVPKAAAGAVAGAAAVMALLLLSLLMLGGSVADFNRHLPFWLGPGDERIMFGEALAGGMLLGALCGILVGLVEALRDTGPA